MKLINIAISILVIGYFMLVSCSSDEGGESGNGPQATGQELERQLLDTHWKLTRETKVENGTEKVLNDDWNGQGENCFVTFPPILLSDSCTHDNSVILLLCYKIEIFQIR